ncbi:MAG: DUF4215 domain-containing protein [Myxococcota bacterium]|nr:DUF4215 domain-containing protein [Myxococcota bacterium]
MRFDPFCRFILVGLLSIGCFDKIELGEHGCDTCRPCEECVASSSGTKCDPVHQDQKQCGSDGNIHWFNSCNEDEGVFKECPVGKSQCINHTGVDAVCECTPNWIGENCDVCPPNWDPDQNCELCRNHWVDENNNCGTCPANWDLEKDCDACRNNWIDQENDCGTCPDGDDPSQDCTSVCGNGIVTYPEECDDANDIQWDECDACTLTVFQVNTYTSSDQNLPSVAMGSDGRFIIVWESNEQDGYAEGIFGQRYDAKGNPDGTEFQVNTDTEGSQISPSVAMAPDGPFTVIWQHAEWPFGGGVIGQQYGEDGNPTGEDILINQSMAGSIVGTSVAMTPNGGFFVVWEEQPGDFLGKFYNEDGTPMDTAFEIYYYGGDPAVAMFSDGRSVTVYSTGAPGNFDVYAQRLSSYGDLIGERIQVGSNETPKAHNAVAADGDGRFIVTWQDDTLDGLGSDIFGRLYDVDGEPEGDAFRINTHKEATQSEPSVAMALDGRFIVAWQSSGQDGDSYGIFAQRFNADGNFVGEEFKLNGYTDGAQSSPAVAMTPDGSIAVIAWQSEGQDGASNGIFAKRLVFED